MNCPLFLLWATPFWGSLLDREADGRGGILDLPFLAVVVDGFSVVVVLGRFGEGAKRP